MTLGDAILSLVFIGTGATKDQALDALLKFHWRPEDGPVMQSVRLDLAATELRRMMGERA